jgi:hypothetical protein
MIETSRRNFFGLLAAPVILRVTKPMSLWMPPQEPIAAGSHILINENNSILSSELINCEVVRLWRECNKILKDFEKFDETIYRTSIPREEWSKFNALS